MCGCCIELSALEKGELRGKVEGLTVFRRGDVAKQRRTDVGLVLDAFRTGLGGIRTDMIGKEREVVGVP